jgi:hypothetical protein
VNERISTQQWPDEMECRYADPIKRGQSYSATASELSACRARARELVGVLADVVLRREKTMLSREVSGHDLVRVLLLFGSDWMG